MKKVEAKILFRPHYLGELITKPNGKTNRQIWEDQKEKVNRLSEKAEEQAEKLKKLNEELKALEPEKDNETPARKNSKSPAQKYRELTEKSKIELSKSEDLRDTLNSERFKLEELEVLKDKIELSATCKRRLKTIAIELRYKRRKRLKNKFVSKGLEQEDEGAELYSEFLGEHLTIEKERKQNDYFTGETDLRKRNKAKEVVEITDVKNRYDLDTFEDNRGEKISHLYKWQGFGYADLYPTAKVFKVANVLCDLDFTLMDDEVRRETYATKADELTATGTLKNARLIELVKEHIYSRENFIKYLSLHIEEGELLKLHKGTSEDEEAQKAFNEFVELEIEERIIEQAVEITDEVREEIKESKKILDACRDYLREVYNIHHIENEENQKG